MPADNYTNVRTMRGPSPVPTYRGSGPYIAGTGEGRGQPLTPREREARRLARMSNGPSGMHIRTSNEYMMGGSIGTNTTLSGTSNFFSPQLSPDFPELPQSVRERREIYKHFYNTDPLVAQAIDLHTEIPMSKVRLAAPKPRKAPKGFESPHEYGEYILSFFQRMCKRIQLFKRLITGVHEYHLMGNAFIFAEDSDVQLPPDIGYERRKVAKAVLQDDGTPVEEMENGWVEHENREEEELRYYQRNYKGWERLIVLPINQVKVTSYSFTDDVKVELIPSDRDRALIEEARVGGDPTAEAMVRKIPEEVRDHIEHGRLIPLSTDPDEGSFVYHLAGRRGADDEMGQSLLDRCLRTLYYKEKLRQAQTMIASRAMTPKRLVWADDISEVDAEALREQVDLSLVDPDYSIVTNYEVHWDEMGSKDRLLDLSSEYELCDKHLITGLGTTEGLMSGETLYSGDRLKLEVINTRYLFLREMLQEYVEEALFKPVARRKGFVEEDKWGEEIVLYPRLTFTRLPLRDSQDTYDALYNLYIKGSVPIEVILEMLNLDAEDCRTKLTKDLFTPNDSLFNEAMRGVYSGAAQTIATESDAVDRIMAAMTLKKKEQPAGEEQPEPRF